jgi:hypothetical protein
MVSAPGVGAIVTLLLLAGGEERGDRKKLLWGTALLSPLAVIFFCMARSLWTGLLLLGLVGAGQVGFRTVARVVIQYDVPAELLGRVISVFSIERGLNSLGSVVLGAFIAVLGAGLGLASAGALALGIMFTLYAYLKPRRPSVQQSS